MCNRIVVGLFWTEVGLFGRRLKGLGIYDDLLDEADNVGLDLEKVRLALEDDNQKAALLAMILERTKAAEGSQMVEIDSPAVEQGRVHARAAPLPTRHRRRAGMIKAAVAIQASWRGFSVRHGGASYSGRANPDDITRLMHALHKGLKAQA